MMKKTLALLLVVILSLNGCSLINKQNNIDKETNLMDVEIILYFGDSQALYVSPEKRLITVSQNISQEEYAKLILDELIKGPIDENLYPTIPPDTKVLNIDIEEDLLYIDFSKEMHINHWGGSAGENMTLLSLANTMTEIDGIKRVIPSVEGTVLNIEHVIVDEPLTRQEDKIYKHD